MDKIKDRRSYDRFLCPGVTVFIFKKYWYKYLQYRILKNIAIFMPDIAYVQNMSKSGILILGKNVFKRGDEICLMISAPGIRCIIIKGKVLWKTNTLEVEQIGIQFLAFSNWRKYNSFNSLKDLNLYISKNQLAIVEYR